MRGSMENIAPGSYVMRRDRLMDELECLEQTISSRRAELHETEQRLVDHNARLEAVQTEVLDNYRLYAFSIEWFLEQCTQQNQHVAKVTEHCTLRGFKIKSIPA